MTGYALADQLAYTLVAFGLWYIVGYAAISKRGRGWLKRVSDRAVMTSDSFLGHFGRFLLDMIQCPGCFGTWAGLGAGFVLQLPAVYDIPAPILLGAYTCASNFLLASLAGIGDHP
jgi:hypothetical protein